jgi:SagB-type dehydrogenase family enzyme
MKWNGERRTIMKKMAFLAICFISIFSLFCSAFAEELKPIQFPKPQWDGGRPLMQVLKDRKSSREFSPEKLSLQVLSNLLWAASGVNRPESGRRTAPTAANWQEIDIYLAMAEGLYVFDAKSHLLKPALAEDIRALAGRQPFVKDAPLNLIYVADFSRIGRGTNEEKEFFSAADTGFIAQNVYLFCASEGLATVVRANIDKPTLAKTMKLGPDQRITLSQTVGYPKK